MTSGIWKECNYSKEDGSICGMRFKTSSSTPRSAKSQTKCPLHRSISRSTGLSRNNTANVHITRSNDQKMKEYVEEMMKNNVLETILDINEQDSGRMSKLNRKLNRISRKIDEMKEETPIESEVAEISNILTGLVNRVALIEKRSLRQAKMIRVLRTEEE